MSLFIKYFNTGSYLHKEKFTRETGLLNSQLVLAFKQKTAGHNDRPFAPKI
ncbi:MAG: hypothetical protein ACI9EW_002000 [Cellvibrionaceae bacterium]|jgi:hypothetical protein